MLTANITKLRNELPKYLHLVQSGEHIIVTSHGKAIARIMPPLDAPKEAKTQLINKRVNQVNRINNAIRNMPPPPTKRGKNFKQDMSNIVKGNVRY